MDFSIIVIALGSVGYIIMALFILLNKRIDELFDTSTEEGINQRQAVRRSGYINLFIGCIGLIMAGILYIFPDTNNVIVILFIIIIVMSSIINLLGNRRKKF